MLLSQTYVSRSINMKDGLPSNQINDLILDSRGFYWIGTNAGLVKWYGRTFEIFGANQGLPSINILAITEDLQGNIWLGLGGAGVVKFNGVSFDLIIPVDSLPGSTITRLKYSSRWDILLIATNEGFAAYKDNEYQIFNLEPQSQYIKEVTISNFLETDSFIYVQSNNNGLFKYYPDIDSIAVSSLNNDRLLRTIAAHITANNDTIWALAYQNIYSVGNRDHDLIEGIAEVYDLAEDGMGNIYLAASSGPFSREGGIFKLNDRKLESLNPLYEISADRLTRVIYDHSDHVLVIADQNQGLFVLYPQMIRREFEGIPQIHDMNIKAFASTEDGTFWLLEDQNLFFRKPDGSFDKFDRRLFENEFRVFMNKKFPVKYSYWLDPDGSYEKYQQMQENGQYPYPNPYQIYQNNEKIIYNDRILYRPDEYKYLKNTQFTNFNNLAAGHDNSLWLLSNIGFFNFNDILNVSFTDYFNVTNEQFEIPDSNIILSLLNNSVIINPLTHKTIEFSQIFAPAPANLTDLYKTSKGVWVSCRNNGLFIFEDEKLRHLNHENNRLKSSITKLTEDKWGNLVAGTNDAGLQIIKFDNNIIEILHEITPEKNIIGNHITWMNTDSLGFLWVGTNLGVNRIDLTRLYCDSTLAINFFNEEEGLFPPTVTTSHTDNEGNIWLGSSGLLAKINHRAVSQSYPGPRKVFINRIDLDNNITQWDDLSQTDPWYGIPAGGLTLKHYNNTLSFYFNTTNISGQDKTLFRYRISGINENWSPFDKNNQLIYPNLPPGRYVLEVEAQQAYDSGSRGSTEFAFRILHPWWQTWWFYTIVVVVLANMFRIILILRVRHVKKTETQKLLQEREISELRIKALQSQMNPHFTFNAINSIQYYILEKDKDSAFLFVGYFSKLVRQTLEFASRDSVSIKEEAAFLKNYIKLEQMRFENKFSFEIQIEPVIDSHQYQIPPMLLQPFAENAILHGLLHMNESGMLRIHFTVSGKDILKCTIEDNGIGRKKSAEINSGRHKQHKSVGLEITRRRVSLFNLPGQKDYRIEIYDLHDNNQQPSGTKILLFIPLNRIPQDEIENRDLSPSAN